MNDEHITTNKGELDFQTLANNIPSLAWMADDKGWIYWYNEKWYQYTGTTLIEMQGWGWKKVHHPDHIDRVVERLQKSWDTGLPWEDVFPLRSVEGEYRWFLSRALPIKNAEGTVIRWFGINTDVTIQRQAEQELVEASIRKDEFLAILGHELRNPLATLLATLEEDISAMQPAELHSRNEVMKRQGYRLKKLVDDLVEISRLSRGQIQLKKEITDLNEQVRYCVKNMEKLSSQRKHTLHIKLAENPIKINADPMRLQQIIENIISNAIRYTEPGGIIDIRTSVNDGKICFSCKDTGVGIPQDKLQFIFDPFMQLNVEADRTDAGMGIGLALVKQLTELHNGTVTVQNNTDSPGTTFTLCFPTATTVEQANKPPANTVTEFATKRILFAEDNTDLVTILKKQFEKNGHHVVAVIDNGTDVIEAVLQHQPEIVLMDIGLPGKDGYQVAEELAALPIRAKMKVIAMSGYNPQKDKEHLFDTFLLKPVQLKELLMQFT